MSKRLSWFMFLVISLAILRPAGLALAAPVVIDDSLYTTRNVHTASSPNLVFTSDTVGYAFYVDSDGTCVYNKTIDSGVTWDGAVVIDGSITDCIRVVVWYDQWTPGDAGTIIHIATINTADMFYTSLDTATDTLSAMVNMTDGSQNNTFTINKNDPSITKGTDGDLYMGVQDNDDSYVIKCTGSCNSDVNWVEAGANPFDLANDWLLLVPLADADILAIRWDISAGDVQSQVYDDATDTWDGSWTTIDLDAPVDTVYNGAFGATIDRTTNDIYLAYAAQTDVMGTDDDIRTAIYSGGTWTAMTDVVTDDAKGITNAKIAINENNQNVYVLYTAQTTPGTLSSANIFYKKSVDGMATWGAEQGPLNDTNRNFFGARPNIMSDDRLYFTAYFPGSDDLLGDNIVIFSSAQGSPYIFTPPVLNSLLIDGKAPPTCSADQEIELRVTADNASRIVIADNELFIGSEWEVFASPMTKMWSLTPDEGTKTVYLLLKSDAGELSNVYSVNVELDSACEEIAPAVEEPKDLSVPENIAEFPSDAHVAAVTGSFGASPFNGTQEDISIVLPGQYIRALSYDTVYYITSDLHRRPFTDNAALMTWLDSRDEIIWVTDATLPTMPLDRPMLIKPGSVLVDVISVPNTHYEVGEKNDTTQLLHVVSDLIIEDTYGGNWQDYLLPIAPTLFSRYEVGEDVIRMHRVDTSKMKTRSQIEALAATLW